MKLPFLSDKLGKRKPHTLGLDLGSDTIKLVELNGSDAQIEIKKAGRALVPDGAIVDGSVKDRDAIVGALKALVENLKPGTKHVSTSIAGYSVIVKRITVNYQDEKEIEDNLVVEAEKYVPFEIDEVYVDFYVLREASEERPNCDIFLVAAKREIVDEYAGIIQEVGLVPSVIDVDAFALGNSFEGAFGVLNEPVALIDIGASKTNMNVISHGNSLFTRDMAFGGRQLTDAIEEATGLRREDAEKVKISGAKDKALEQEVRSICDELCSVWVDEIKKAIDFCQANSPPEEHPTHLFLSGGTALLRGFPDFMSRKIDIPVSLMNPMKQFSTGKDINPEYIEGIAPQFTIATGLALRTIPL